MPLTNEQLHEVRRIIRDHHLAFIVNVIGVDAVAPEIVEQLNAQGLVDLDVSSIEDAYLYGVILSMATDPMLPKMSYEDFKRYVQKNPVPLTEPEKRAVQFAQQRAGQHIVGLGNKIDQATGQLMVDADAKLRDKMRGKVQDATAENIARRNSIKQLKSKLMHSTGDWARDWDRVAVTEKHTSMQQGIADKLSEEYGDPKVAKRPTPDACEHCKRLYLGPDGQPYIFKLSQLQANGLNNFGRKAADWLPVIGSTHPHCQCQIIRIPEGWGFDEEGSLVPGGEFGVEAGDVEDFQKSIEARANLEKAFELQDRIRFQGMDIAIEQKAGQTRKWTDEEGNEGETVMVYAYGYVEGTMGADEDETDVFIGPDPQAEYAYVIHQQQPGRGVYDEDKVMLGFSSEAAARSAYQWHYNRPDFYVTMSPMPIDQFKRWVGVSGPKPGEMFKAGKPVDKFIVLEKKLSGIGSRGGKVTGYDKDGKPIYAKRPKKMLATRMAGKDKFDSDDKPKNRKYDGGFTLSVDADEDEDDLEKARELATISGSLDAIGGAATSMAVARNPGPGTVINHMVGTKRTPPPSAKDLKPDPREWVDDHKHDRYRGQGQSIDRDRIVFDQPLQRKATKFVVPSEWGKKATPEEIEANREVVEKEQADRSKQFKNPVEVSDEDSKEYRERAES